MLFAASGCTSHVNANVEESSDGIMTPPVLFNEAESTMSISLAMPTSHFPHDLTDEEVNAVFYGINMSLSASAWFREDGSLCSITASNSATDLLIGLGDYPDNSTYAFNHFDEDSPIATNIHGVPVIFSIVDASAGRLGSIFSKRFFD